MKICGLKLTHDGAVALIDDQRLVFCIEMEKIKDNPRYSSIEETSDIATILEDQGYSVDDIDIFAIDGWGGYDQDALALQPRLQIGDTFNKLSVYNNGVEEWINVAQYQERTLQADILKEWDFDELHIEDQSCAYKSVLHVTGHVMSAYCTSPFAQKMQDAYILIWDGGMYPRLYFFDAASKKVINYGPIFLLIGNIYTIFSQHFGPFEIKGGFAKDSLSVAGKVMAYIALGKTRSELFPVFEKIYNEFYTAPMGFANVFANEFKKQIDRTQYSDEDILCTMHHYFGNLLVEKLEKKIGRLPHTSRNICLGGGCALNIKWNSDVRNNGFFKEVYVPPFPNDSGSAIGAACTVMLNHTGNAALEWSVYSGPAIIKNKVPEGWFTTNCSITDLARLLFEKNEPVVFLNGRAELGPRALGNRSILAAAVSPGMKDILNQIKKREHYRPVSPIGLLEYAADIFEPGSADPYMLFDHTVKREWLRKIPAICHLDHTARLQTVTSKSNPEIAALLMAYCGLSGIPLLCNTSANHSGKGFFPSVQSAIEWDQVNYIWCDGTMFERTDKLSFLIPGTGKAVKAAQVF